jgi:hypothetical protein
VLIDELPDALKISMSVADALVDDCLSEPFSQAS